MISPLCFDYICFISLHSSFYKTSKTSVNIFFTLISFYCPCNATFYILRIKYPRATKHSNQATDEFYAPPRKRRSILMNKQKFANQQIYHLSWWTECPDPRRSTTRPATSSTGAVPHASIVSTETRWAAPRRRPLLAAVIDSSLPACWVASGWK